MRIISGKYKGRKVEPPSDSGIRPTTDRAREALFNLLDNRLAYEWECIDVLDLFSGSGAVSIEFLSRGVRSAVSVEKNPKTAAYLRKCSEELEADDRWEICCESAEMFLAHPYDRKFDVIFLDPPYNIYDKTVFLKPLFTDFLASEGWVVLEHPTGEKYESIPYFKELRTYSGSSFSFFHYELPA